MRGEVGSTAHTRHLRHKSGEKRVMEELRFYLKGTSGLLKEWSYIIKHTLKKTHHGCMGEKVNQRRIRLEDR